MTLEKNVSKIFLHDDQWLNHANPVSVWSRIPILFFLVVAIWSRLWIGWFSLIPIGFFLIWTFINPSFFKKPKTTQNWASKCVLGEMIFANRGKISIPKSHIIARNITYLIQFTGAIFLVYGLYEFHVWSTFLGLVLIYLEKIWFLDRMV